MTTDELQQKPAACGQKETENHANVISGEKITSGTEKPRRSSRLATSSLCSNPELSAPQTRRKLPKAPRLNREAPIMTEYSSRRNPKRKASEPSKCRPKPPAELMEQAMQPLKQTEIEDWEGWVELESEPSFFNIILRDLGVQNVRAQELFGIDQDSVNFLPKPIFGFIFLFQYVEDHDEKEIVDEPRDVWFANQTTNNACATVALLNIVMNASEVVLGDELQSFKQSTKDLNTALRGYRIASNTFIRSKHNSFTRRMDHLCADLSLENEANKPQKKKARAHNTANKGKVSNRKKVPDEDYAFHFIAYVPSGGHVWELDGLRSKPHNLGAIDSGDWTAVARPQIQARMAEYEDNQLSFNVLALCRSALAVYSRKIAETLAALRYLFEEIPSQPGLSKFTLQDDWLEEACTLQSLSEFQLTPSEIQSIVVPQAVSDKVTALSSEQEARDLYGDLEIEAKAAIGEYRAELLSMAEDEQRVKGRKKDYGAAVHKWVTKLAEKGVLEDLINGT